MCKKIFITLALVVIVATLFAQPQNPPGDPDKRVPISGIGILIGAGALLGIARIVFQNKMSGVGREKGYSKEQPITPRLLQRIRNF